MWVDGVMGEEMGVGGGTGMEMGGRHSKRDAFRVRQPTFGAVIATGRVEGESGDLSASG
jgi:hypothetical protein